MTGFLFLLKRIVWFFWDNKRYLAILLAIIALIIAIAFTYSWCGKRKARLNQEEIIKLQKAIAESDRQAMEKILVDSDVREKRIDENVVNAKTDTINAIADAKKKASQMSNEELAAELERRAKEE